MIKTKLLLIFGGESPEHEISILSAKNVAAAIDQNKYQVTYCYITKDGAWVLQDNWTGDEPKEVGDRIAVIPGAKQCMNVSDNSVLEFDVAFPVLHGKNGEDGTIQGLLAMMKLPMVGCNVESSALCMHKDATKRVLASYGIPVANGMTVHSGYDIEQVQIDVSKKLGAAPWFVKPSRVGSSIGVRKVANESELTDAIVNALQFDDTVLIEEAIIGRELEVAVLGNVPRHSASVVGEIITGAEFYDYDDKYSEDSESQVKLNVTLPADIEENIRSIAERTFEYLGCGGLSRVDFLMDGEGKLYVNEVNTMPGFTNISMYPKLWQEQGVSYAELIDSLIELALE